MENNISVEQIEVKKYNKIAISAFVFSLMGFIFIANRGFESIIYIITSKNIYLTGSISTALWGLGFILALVGFVLGGVSLLIKKEVVEKGKGLAVISFVIFGFCIVSFLSVFR